VAHWDTTDPQTRAHLHCGITDERLHLLQCRVIDERAKLHARRRAVADGQRRGLLREALHKRVVDAILQPRQQQRDSTATATAATTAHSGNSSY
jgi:hypothetical protein